MVGQLARSYGGHCGPYYSLAEARADAIRRLSGSAALAYVEIRMGVAGPLVETCKRDSQ